MLIISCSLGSLSTRQGPPVPRHPQSHLNLNRMHMFRTVGVDFGLPLYMDCVIEYQSRQIVCLSPTTGLYHGAVHIGTHQNEHVFVCHHIIFRHS